MVRSTAVELNVSQSTIWRRLRAGRLHVHAELEPEACGYCGTPLPWSSTIRRIYCSDVCRVYAWRGR